MNLIHVAVAFCKSCRIENNKKFADIFVTLSIADMPTEVGVFMYFTQTLFCVMEV